MHFFHQYVGQVNKRDIAQGANEKADSHCDKLETYYKKAQIILPHQAKEMLKLFCLQPNTFG